MRNLGKAFSVFGHCEGTKQATDGKLLLYSTRVKMEAASCQQNEKRAVPKTGKRDGLSGASGSSSCSAGRRRLTMSRKGASLSPLQSLSTSLFPRTGVIGQRS